MKVDWSQTAIHDLIGIDALISKDSPRYASLVVDRITARTQQLAVFPQSGQIVAEYRRRDIREVLVYSYRVLYRVDDE